MEAFGADKCHSLIELKCANSGQLFIACEEDESELSDDDDLDTDIDEYDGGLIPNLDSKLDSEMGCLGDKPSKLADNKGAVSELLSLHAKVSSQSLDKFLR